MITRKTTLSICITDADGDHSQISGVAGAPYQWAAFLTFGGNDDVGVGITCDEAVEMCKVLENIIRASRGEE